MNDTHALINHLHMRVRIKCAVYRMIRDLGYSRLAACRTALQH